MWDKFFTPPDVADFIISLLNIPAPKEVIDLCAGSWNLLSAAKRRWPDTALIGVDINSFSTYICKDNEENFCQDGRDFALSCIKKEKRFPLVVANPPFGHDNNYSGYSFGYDFNNKILARIEATMLLANLSIVEDNGILAIILPASFVSKQSMQPLRLLIGGNYQLSRLIYLPDNIFGNDIKTVALIISNSKLSEDTMVSSLNNNGTPTLEKIIDLPRSYVLNGNWVGIPFQKALMPSGGTIFRGNISNNSLQKSGIYPVIHISDFSSISQNQFIPTRFTNSLPDNSNKFSRNGDIIISRVGKKCGMVSKITFSEQFAYSDCVIALRFEESIDIKIGEVLFKPTFMQELQRRAKGTCARYLTFDDVTVAISLALGTVGQ